MRLNSTIRGLSAISLLSLLLTSAYAHNGSWLSDSSGNGVKDSSKKCVKSAGGNEPDGCGAPKPEPPPPPVVVTPPPPPPPVVVAKPKPKPIPRPRAPVVQVLNLNESGGSNFATASAKLNGNARATLDDFVNRVKSSGVPASNITIVGHTDSRGSKKYNQGLSVRRAESVAQYLAGQGLSGNMQVSGSGESEPVASNKSRAGRAQNRRVNIQVSGQKRVTR